MGMLVVSRKESESILIGETLVTILRSGHSVSVGIDAPREVPIVRLDAAGDVQTKQQRPPEPEPVAA